MGMFVCVLFIETLNDSQLRAVSFFELVNVSTTSHQGVSPEWQPQKLSPYIKIRAEDVCTSYPLGVTTVLVHDRL